MAESRIKLPKLKSVVVFRLPYLRHLKYRAKNAWIKHRWRSYYRKEILRFFNQALDFDPIEFALRARQRPSDCLIEINNTCNLRCPMCSTNLSKREKKNMDLGTYRRVLERVKEAGINIVSLYTVGEPLVYPWLEEAVSIAKNMGIRIGISTNANLVERLKNLYASNPEWIESFGFSVDGATPQTYEKMRRGGELKKVMESCEWILRVNKHRHMSRIALSITCVISKDNIREIATFMHRFSKYTFPECIHFMLVNSLSPDTTYFDERSLSFSNLYRLNVPCHISVFNRIYVNNEGQVTLCCRDYENKLVIGDVLIQPLLAVWRSEQADKIRRQHLGKKDLTIAECKKCYFPKPGLDELLNSYIHYLQYVENDFDDTIWCNKILDFLRDLNAQLGDSEKREERIKKVLSHL